jgi:hypothetical protein
MEKSIIRRNGELPFSDDIDSDRTGFNARSVLSGASSVFDSTTKSDIQENSKLHNVDEKGEFKNENDESGEEDSNFTPMRKLSTSFRFTCQ